jgi:PadR family transcriptional regulator, regulatory protein PadR
MLYMMNDKDLKTIYDKLNQELRRGILVLAILSQLQEAKYGYDLISHLGELGLEIEQGTLYPLLRRLEGQDLLVSEWVIEGSRPRRYYKISPSGQKVLTKMIVDWREIAAVVDGLLKTIE